MKPSRRVIALLIVCSTIVGVVIYVNTNLQKKPQVATTAENNYQAITVEKGFNENADIDSDNDGLKNWEEVMWNTDTENPDTDGDKTSDGEEVTQNRNPLKKGPNDKLSEQEKLAIGTTTIANGFVKNSATDNFSKDFFENYLQAKNDGTLIIEGQDSLVKSMVDKAVTDFKEAPRYTKGDLTVFSADLAKSKSYGTSFALIQKRKLNDIYLAANKNDLPATAIEYKKLSEELFALSVPQEIADTHLQIINNIYTVYETYTSISKYEKDPLKTLFYIKEHKRISDEQVKLYTSIKNYFLKNGIIFDNSDAASYWSVF